MEALFFASIQTSPVTPTNASLNHRAHLPLSFSSKWLPFKSHRSSPIPSLQKPTNTHKSNSSSCTRNFLSPIKSHLSSLKSSVTNVASTATRWMVVMENPPNAAGSSKSEIIDYYVKALAGVLGNEKEAQMCIYDASWQTNFGFCCDVDEETAKQIAGLPGVLSVRPDIDFEAKEKDYSFSNSLSGLLSKSNDGASQFPPPGNSKYWIVGMEKPSVEVVSKAQMVDYYAKTLTRVLGNEKDAQVSIYHISWQKIYGFCCEMDKECARELAGVPGVLSVQPDTNFESENKQYGGENKTSKLTGSPDSSDASQEPSIKTKRLFVTGLSFYTSEKTLRAAFEGFGELVEVKIIMDKISKRSKGYAFIEYTTEESASAALKEMNGKIINGWMIVVDVAKTNPPKYGLTRTSSAG